MTEMETIQIQQNVPYSLELTVEDNSVDPAVPYDLTGRTVFISVKELNDERQDDTEALISSAIAVHTNPLLGETTWTLTAAQTYIPVKTYKVDVRIYTNAAEFLNSDTFNIEIVKIVTKRTV
jgi:hypothetical protein